MQELVVEAKDENLGTILDVIEEKLDQMEEAGRFVLESPAEPEQEKLPQ